MSRLHKNQLQQHHQVGEKESRPVLDLGGGQPLEADWFTAARLRGLADDSVKAGGLGLGGGTHWRWRCLWHPGRPGYAAAGEA